MKTTPSMVNIVDSFSDPDVSIPKYRHLYVVLTFRGKYLSV